MQPGHLDGHGRNPLHCEMCALTSLLHATLDTEPDADHGPSQRSLFWSCLLAQQEAGALKVVNFKCWLHSPWTLSWT